MLVKDIGSRTYGSRMMAQRHTDLHDKIVDAIEEVNIDPHETCEVMTGFMAGVISVYSGSEREVEKSVKTLSKVLMEEALKRFRERKKGEV